jgi:hypothetical protein
VSGLVRFSRIAPVDTSTGRTGNGCYMAKAILGFFLIRTASLICSPIETGFD